MLNKVLLIGHVGMDPQVSYYGHNQALASFYIALNRHTDTSATLHPASDAVDWVRIIAFGRWAQKVEQNIKKGCKIYIEGRLSTRVYTDKSGKQNRMTSVIAEQISLLETTRRIKKENPSMGNLIEDDVDQTALKEKINDLFGQGAGDFFVPDQERQEGEH